MPTSIAFKDCAVAFIDLLGFSSLVTKATKSGGKSLDELERVVNLLDEVMPALDSTVSSTVPPEAIPKHLYFSDSIILSAPLMQRFDGREYFGMRQVVMRSIQLTHIVLKAGYLLRGAIDAGSVWHSEDGLNIVGTAFMNAYAAEKKADSPRIVLCDNAAEIWRRDSLGQNTMCIEYEGSLMVNGLHEYYASGRDEYQSLESIFDEYRAIINRNLLDGSIGCKAKKKWKWFKKRFEDEDSRMRSLGWHNARPAGGR
jgi:hypothetical protein